MTRMRLFRRSLIALGMAAMLPTLVFLSVGLFLFLRAESQRVETDSLDRSRVVMTLIDASLRGDAAALSIFGASIYLESREWRQFYSRLQRAVRANPHWTTIVLYDAERGEEILDLRRPLGNPRRVALIGGGDLEKLSQAEGAVIGGMNPTRDHLVFVYFPVARDGQLRYVIAAGIKPQVFQDILLANAPGESTSALVDRDGVFVARTVNYEARIGKLATTHVREAISRGASGLYRGTTYEGVENYTAFTASNWSGWSAHIAIASSLIDAPTSWSFIVAAVAGIGSTLLGATLVVLVLRDMSERRRSEDALRQSQKMEAVGQLTGGIAHDFNNLLTAIIGNLDLIRTRVAGQERVQRLADNALEAARRGAKLTSQLLAFSRTQRLQVQPVDLQQIIDGMNSLLAQSVGPSIELKVTISPTACGVMSDPNQLELAILNLAVNARDAMPQGGSLTITSTLTARPALPQLQNGSYVQLSISDTGAGMTDEVRNRAMEPFFTTKPLGQGTGLGLAQVYGIVRESGGAVEIVSAINQGTTIHVYLPRVTTVAPRPDPPSAVAIPPPATHNASVLIVDDDPRVRHFMAEAIRDSYVRVTEACNGESALAALAQSTFDLMIVDFAMPQMNGADVVRAALSVQPSLKVLMVSGYSDSAAIDTVMDKATLLKKPFDANELIAAVHRSLDANATSPT